MGACALGRISFRPLQRTDFLLLQRWFLAPHVARWWNERADLASIEAKYGPRVDRAEPTHVSIVEHEGSAIGWIQWYLWADYPEHSRQLGADESSAGIDLAIGEVGMTGLGLGPVILSKFLKEFACSHPAVRAVVTDPEETNFRSVRAFMKAGFRAINAVQLVGEESKRIVMRSECQ